MTTIDAPLLPDLLGTSPADLIDQYAPEADPSTPDEARERAERVRAGLLSYFEMRQDIADAFARQDWKALDYGSWFEYVEAEFGAVLTGLSRDERREAARDLQAQGMSTRQIAAATNVSQKQARRDLGQVSPSDVKPRVSPKDSPDPNGSPTADGPAGPVAPTHDPRAEATSGDSRPQDRPGAEPSKSEDPKLRPEDRPGYWSPEERKAHEAEVRRLQDIESAKRASQNIVTQVRSLVVTVVTGSRYGEKNLVNAEMIADLRKAIDLLEGEL